MNNHIHTTLDTPLILKTYDLYKKFFDIAMLFPKKIKYTLGTRCEVYILTMLELLVAASNTTRDKKLNFVQQASVKLDTLKILLRLATETKALDEKKCIALQKDIQEIGKMLGGWQRSLPQ